MKGSRQWRGVISVQRASAPALRGRALAPEPSITEAPREPDESQQDPSQSVNHFPLRNTQSEPWKQIIGNDFMTIADHTGCPAGDAVQLWGRRAARRQIVTAPASTLRTDVRSSLTGSGVYSSSRWFSERRRFVFCFCFSRWMVKPRLWCAEAWRGWLRATQNRHHRSRFALLLLGDADGRLQRRLRKEQMNGRTDWQIDWLMDDGLTEGQRIWDFCSCCFSGTGW